MSRSKKSRKHNESAEDEENESSSSESDDSRVKSRSQRKGHESVSKKKALAENAKGKKITRSEDGSSSSGSSSSPSSSSSSSSSSSDEESDASSSATEQAQAKTARHTKNGDARQRARSRSAERSRKSKYAGEQGDSKWDSPRERARHQSDNKSRQRERGGSRERERSRERDSKREQERPRDYRERERDRGRERDERTDRGRYDYGNSDRAHGRRDYQARDTGRHRDDRARDERDRRSERYNERRERSRSPRRERDGNRERQFGDGRVKKESEQHSPARGRDRQHGTTQRRNNRRGSPGEDNKSYEWGGRRADEKPGDNAATEPVEKEKPNFALSGALTEDTNKVNGVVVKYAEPPEARKPKRRWRLYPFKGETALPTLHIHRQSCFLVGRDRKVVDLAVDHPSCSKQHAALQYRLVPFEREDGTQGKRVRLYLIDLESANGTFLNNKKIEPRKYYELMEKDVIKFGFSTREYVLLHENSKEDQEDDDVMVKQEPEDIPDGPNP